MIDEQPDAAEPEPARRNEQRAEIRVYAASEDGDYDPDAFTERIGIEPTRLYRKGEILRSGRPRGHTVWWWETEEQTTRDTEAVVIEVLDRFEPVLQQLGDAKTELDLHLVLGVVISMYGVIETDPDGEVSADAATPAFALSVETLQRLGRLGADFDVDQYVFAPAAL